MKKTGEIAVGVTPPESEDKVAEDGGDSLEDHLTKRIADVVAEKETPKS